MNTVIEFGIKFGPIASVVGAAASQSAVAIVVVAIAVLLCYLAHEVRVALRERRDDATARFMFERCRQPGAAFTKYAEVLKSRDSPP